VQAALALLLTSIPLHAAFSEQVFPALLVTFALSAPEALFVDFPSPAGVGLIPVTSPYVTPVGIGIYAVKCKDAVVFSPHPASRKTTIETALTEGHALGWADFDGDGSDELAVGWRRGKPGLAVYTVGRDGALRSKQLIDDGGIDCEDLIVGDFDGDGRPDIVASGRATRNVRIYWNETAPPRR